MQFFKISVRLCFSVDLLFSFFFLWGVSWSYRQTDMHQMWHEDVFLHLVWNSFEKFGKSQKTRSRRAKKTSKNRQNSSTEGHIFARCDKTVKVEEKIKTGFSNFNGNVLPCRKCICDHLEPSGFLNHGTSWKNARGRGFGCSATECRQRTCKCMPM